MLLAACEQFLGKQEHEIQHIALVTLEGHQRAIMGSMTVEVNQHHLNLSLCILVNNTSTIKNRLPEMFRT